MYLHYSQLILLQILLPVMEIMEFITLRDTTQLLPIQQMLSHLHMVGLNLLYLYQLCKVVFLFLWENGAVFIIETTLRSALETQLRPITTQFVINLVQLNQQ